MDVITEYYIRESNYILSNYILFFVFKICENLCLLNNLILQFNANIISIVNTMSQICMCVCVCPIEPCDNGKSISTRIDTNFEFQVGTRVTFEFIRNRKLPRNLDKNWAQD